MDDYFEPIILEQDSETLATVLTLIMSNLNPEIDKGVTYELVVNLIADMIYCPFPPEEIDAKAAELSHMVLQTVGAKYLRN